MFYWLCSLPNGFCADVTVRIKKSIDIFIAMKKIFWVVTGILLFASCASNEIANSGDVNQDAIHQAYSIQYTEGNNETHIRATYRFGGANGTTLVLTSPSSVTFDGESMTRYESELEGAYYKQAFSRPLNNRKKYEFVFTDTEGKKYSNSVNFNAVLLGKTPETIKAGMPLEITIVTPPLVYGEQLSFELRDEENNKADFVLEDKPIQKQFIIPASVLKGLKGTVTMQITRSYYSKIKEGTSEGGTIFLEYRLKPLKFTIN